MNHAKLDNRYADALARVERMEKKVMRAINAWQKAKAELKRIGARIDKRMDALLPTEKG